MTFTLDIDQLTLADALHLVSPTPLSTETHGALLPALLAELPPITTDAAYDFPAAMEDLNVQLLRTHTAENMDLSSGDTLDSYTPFASAAGEIQIELFGEFSAGDWTVDLYLDADTTPTLSQIVTLPAGTSDYRLLTRPIALGPADSVRVDLTNIAATDNSYTVRWFDRTPATVADLQTALDAQGYSATRAATLDNLDAPVT
ncbi:MAG: hypothetical protein HN909_07765, partial [Phycisphaerales bacterium]|nr:hypothetical protein [Phycisphaerales bacterium]